MVSWKRSAPLFRLRSLPGWAAVVFATDFLGKIHLANFILEIGGHMIAWLQANPVFLLVAGFARLGIAVFWPDIKRHLPKIPTPPHERLEHLEVETIPALTRRHVDLDKRVDSIDAEFRDRVDIVEMRGAETASKVESGAKHLGSLESRVSAAESDYAGQRQHSDFIDGLIQQKLAPRLDITGKETAAIIDALGGVPEVIVRLCEYALLLHEAIECADMLGELRTLCPSSPVAMTPFFSTWRPHVGVVASDDVMDGVRWIRSLEAHWKHIDGWRQKRGTSSPELLTGDLNVYVSQAKLKHFDVSGDIAEKLLADHIARIKTLMDDYAAAVAGNASVIPMMSRIDQTR